MEKSIDKLKKLGYKITRPRQQILTYFQKQTKPKSVKEIYKSLSKANIDKVTIYRVLELFKEIGIAFEEKVDGESLFYTAKKQHHHAICIECHYIECIPCHNEVRRPKSFTSINHQVMISGICKNCA